jgi:hypothetical protein
MRDHLRGALLDSGFQAKEPQQVTVNRNAGMVMLHLGEASLGFDPQEALQFAKEIVMQAHAILSGGK